MLFMKGPPGCLQYHSTTTGMLRRYVIARYNLKWLEIVYNIIYTSRNIKSNLFFSSSKAVGTIISKGKNVILPEIEIFGTFGQYDVEKAFKYNYTIYN